MKIRVLSRKSDLAIIQAREFSDYLQSKHPFVEIEFLTRSTSGDKDLKTPLSEMPTEGVFTNENITSYILGLSSNLELNKNFNLTGSLGFAEGFSYSFATSNLALKLSENFHLFYGIGGYYISDEKWNPTGLDGNEPSRYDFGMNMGLQLYLTNHLGLIVRYNIIEEKEEEIIGSSMSINGLSFGLILK